MEKISMDMPRTPTRIQTKSIQTGNTHNIAWMLNKLKDGKDPFSPSNLSAKSNHKLGMPRTPKSIHTGKTQNITWMIDRLQDGKDPFSSSNISAKPNSKKLEVQGSSFDRVKIERKMKAAEEKMARVFIQGTDRNIKCVGVDGHENKNGVSIENLEGIEDIRGNSNADNDSEGDQSEGSESESEITIQPPQMQLLQVRRDGIVLSNKRSFRVKSLQQIFNQMRQNRLDQMQNNLAIARVMGFKPSDKIKKMFQRNILPSWRSKLLAIMHFQRIAKKKARERKEKRKKEEAKALYQNVVLKRNERIERAKMLEHDFDAPLMKRKRSLASKRKAQDITEYPRNFPLIVLTQPDSMLHVISQLATRMKHEVFPLKDVESMQTEFQGTLELSQNYKHLAIVDSLVWKNINCLYEEEKKIDGMALKGNCKKGTAFWASSPFDMSGSANIKHLNFEEDSWKFAAFCKIYKEFEIANQKPQRNQSSIPEQYYSRKSDKFLEREKIKNSTQQRSQERRKTAVVSSVNLFHDQAQKSQWTQRDRVKECTSNSNTALSGVDYGQNQKHLPQPKKIGRISKPQNIENSYPNLQRSVPLVLDSSDKVLVAPTPDHHPRLAATPLKMTPTPKLGSPTINIFSSTNTTRPQKSGFSPSQRRPTLPGGLKKSGRSPRIASPAVRQRSTSSYSPSRSPSNQAIRQSSPPSALSHAIGHQNSRPRTQPRGSQFSKYHEIQNSHCPAVLPKQTMSLKFSLPIKNAPAPQHRKKFQAQPRMDAFSRPESPKLKNILYT